MTVFSFKSQRLKNLEKKTGMSENHTGKPMKTVSYDERSGTGVAVSGTISFYVLCVRVKSIVNSFHTVLSVPLLKYRKE